MKMMQWLLVASVLLVPWTMASDVSSSSGKLVVPAVVAAQENNPAPAVPKIDVNIDSGDKRVVWYATPTFLAVAGVGVLLFIVLIAMAARGGGGTTIVREK
jgi:hypothetical protein